MSFIAEYDIKTIHAFGIPNTVFTINTIEYQIVKSHLACHIDIKKGTLVEYHCVRGELLYIDWCPRQFN